MASVSTNNPDRRSALTRSAAFASISVAVLLLGLKIYAAIVTDSAAMLGSLADTALDLVASLSTLVGVWVASQPADANHRFGHGKAEALAALVQVILISISAVGIAARAISQWLGNVRPEEAETGIAVSVIALVATLALLAWQRYVIAHTSSVAIRTDHVHYQSDILLNLGVIAALALDRWIGFSGADPLFALGIAGWLAWNAFQASREAVDHLMDKEWPIEKREKLLELMRGTPGLEGVHDLRTRTSGNQDFAQFHVWVDANMTVKDAHDVMDRIEDELHIGFPDTEFLIHPDPLGIEEDGPYSQVDLLETGPEPDIVGMSEEKG
ncbi:cation diffusion facilitator family transporter [Croceicoccus mobilis]|uniref:Iron transporter n=1 Tax=Croceicoccus mobilis TaxID=1703339 RepID=A0A916YTI9_9SPHN|nr:cation diffusion facilitator family transporter [Croceicoccus mobilis]GGD59623.1 iron transporter [Croceicoccus mobilis]